MRSFLSGHRWIVPTELRCAGKGESSHCVAAAGSVTIPRSWVQLRPTRQKERRQGTVLRSHLSAVRLLVGVNMRLVHPTYIGVSKKYLTRPHLLRPTVPVPGSRRPPSRGCAGCSRRSCARRRALTREGGTGARLQGSSGTSKCAEYRRVL